MCNNENSLARTMYLNTNTTKGMSGDKSRIQDLAVIYCSQLIMKAANKRAVALCFQREHVPLSNRGKAPVIL